MGERLLWGPWGKAVLLRGATTAVSSPRPCPGWERALERWPETSDWKSYAENTSNRKGTKKGVILTISLLTLQTFLRKSGNISTF